MELHTALSPVKLSFRHVGWGLGSSEPTEPPGSVPVYNTFFCRATLCVSAIFAVACCPSVCPSVRQVGDYIHTAVDIVNFLFGPVAPLL